MGSVHGQHARSLHGQLAWATCMASVHRQLARAACAQVAGGVLEEAGGAGGDYCALLAAWAQGRPSGDGAAGDTHQRVRAGEQEPSSPTAHTPSRLH